MKRSPLRRITPLRAKTGFKNVSKPLGKKKPRKSTYGLKEAKKRAWDARSRYVRQFERGVCYTCGKQDDWKKMQAGHYRHSVLDFDDMNIHNQCVYCNHHLSGNGGNYAMHLIKDYGLEAVEDLHNRAKMETGKTYSKEYFQEQQLKYDALLVDLLIERN